MSNRHYIVTMTENTGTVHILDVFAVDRPTAISKARKHFNDKIGPRRNRLNSGPARTFRAALAKGCDCKTCRDEHWFSAPKMVAQPVQQQQAQYRPAIVTDAPETITDAQPGQWINYQGTRGRFMGVRNGVAWIAWEGTARKRFEAFAAAFNAHR